MSGKENVAVNTGSLAPVSLLKKIDQLRERNVTQHVALPQLVVVGDQSSGKSSVLESLTKIPFPRALELCTRYATQISSRRDVDEYIDVSIIPGPSASEEHRARLAKYHPRWRGSESQKSNFDILKILQEVNDCMRIKSDPSSKDGRVFTDDVLKIEICGPEQDYLTIIDVPGIFRNPTEGVTTKEDIDLVKNMVRRYMENIRTVILAVLPSNIDIATQEILSLAEEFDKDGRRTLGVLTKPDLVTEKSAKDMLCNLVLGNKRKLTLGYYLIKNRGPDDNGEVNYDRLDALFQQKPWSSLPRERVGIRALKKALGELLASITRREFPSLRADISEQLNACHRELHTLGAARHTEHQQRLYLSQIAGKFQELVWSALTPRYTDDFFEQNATAKILTYVVNVSQIYTDVLQDAGALRHFVAGNSDTEQSDKSDDGNSSTWSDGKVKKQLPLVADLDLGAYPELDGIIQRRDWCNYEGPSDGIMQWIEGLYLSNRGLDLGTPGSNGVLSNAFKEQTTKWGEITALYISYVVVIVHRFICTALEHVCGDSEVREELRSRLFDEVLSRYEAAMKKAEFLATLERKSQPYTLNQDFSDRLHSPTPPNSDESSESSDLIKLFQGDSPQKRRKLNNALPIQPVEYVTRQIHDILYSYYEVARKRFNDNVYQQAVDYCLLNGPDSPLSVFTQEWVLRLDASELDVIAGESPVTKERRAFLEKKIEDLEEAVRILK